MKSKSSPSKKNRIFKKSTDNNFNYVIDCLYNKKNILFSEVISHSKLILKNNIKIMEKKY